MDSPAPELDVTVEPGHMHVQATIGKKYLSKCRVLGTVLFSDDKEERIFVHGFHFYL